MCGVSGVELLVVIVAAVILLGPDRLPELMRWLGRAMREVRSLTGDLTKVRDEIRSTVSMDDLRAQVREELQLERAREARKDAESEIDAIRKRLKAAVDDEEAPKPEPASAPADAAIADEVPAAPAEPAHPASPDAPAEPSTPAAPAPASDPLAAAGVKIRPAAGSVAHQDGLDDAVDAADASFDAALADDDDEDRP